VAESRDDLRERYAEAMLKHHIDPSQTDADGHDYCVCGGWASGEMSEGWDDHLAEVALAVRDDELHELRATVAGLNYTVGRLIEQVSEADVRAEHAEAELECLRVAVNPTKVGAVSNLVSSATRLIRVERDDARAALARVRALHVPAKRGGVDICDACSPRAGDGPRRYVVQPWPCDTIRALDVPADRDQPSTHTTAEETSRG
jgi:hypothetical protein